MIVKEREPLVYYSPAPSSEWSGAAIVFTSALVALLLIMLYYFTALYASNMDNMPAPSTVIEQPIPMAEPNSILIPTPSAMPQHMVPTPRSLAKPDRPSSRPSAKPVVASPRSSAEPAVPSPRSLAKPVPAQLVPRIGESREPARAETADNS